MKKSVSVLVDDAYKISSIGPVTCVSRSSGGVVKVSTRRTGSGRRRPFADDTILPARIRIGEHRTRQRSAAGAPVSSSPSLSDVTLLVGPAASEYA